MPRRTGSIALPTNESDGSSFGGRISKNITFFGMVGAVWTALSLKERWDAYKRVPADSNATNPLGAPASYQDDSDEEDQIGMRSDTLSVNTQLPTRQSRKRSKNCCVCCGLRCGLFCKALGIVTLIFVVWNVFKLARWAITPAKTGLEDMPEYSKSLGCANAQYVFTEKQDVTYPVPSSGDHVIELGGGSGTVGTLLLKPNEDNGQIRVQTTVRARENELSKVAINTPLDQPDSSQYELKIPLVLADCIRFEMTVYIPSDLKGLRINAKPITQIKFDESFAASPRILEQFAVRMWSLNKLNMFLPTTDFSGEVVDIRLSGGYLVGGVSVMNRTYIGTALGTAISNVQFTAPENSSSSSPANLTTVIGRGRSDFTYSNPSGRTINSVHESRYGGDMYLTYKNAGFNGPVDLQARSYTAIGLQGTVHPIPKPSQEGDDEGDKQPYVGSRSGKDRLKITSRSGWVGIYF